MATFRCDITPPLGQPMFACDPLHTVEQPLLGQGDRARGGRPTVRAVRLGLVRIVQRVARDDAEHDRGGRRRGAWPRGRAVRSSAHRAAGRYGRPKAAGRRSAPRSVRLDPKVFDAIAERLAAAVKQSLDRLEPFDRGRRRSGQGGPRGVEPPPGGRNRARSAFDSAPPKSPTCGPCPRERSIPT